MSAATLWLLSETFLLPCQVHATGIFILKYFSVVVHLTPPKFTNLSYVRLWLRCMVRFASFTFVLIFDIMQLIYFKFFSHTYCCLFNPGSVPIHMWSPSFSASCLFSQWVRYLIQFKFQFCHGIFGCLWNGCLTGTYMLADYRFHYCWLQFTWSGVV